MNLFCDMLSISRLTVKYQCSYDFNVWVVIVIECVYDSEYLIFEVNIFLESKGGPNLVSGGRGG